MYIDLSRIAILNFIIDEIFLGGVKKVVIFIPLLFNSYLSDSNWVFNISFHIYAATVFQQKVPPYTQVCLLGQSQPVLFWVRGFHQYPLEYHYNIQ